MAIWQLEPAPAGIGGPSWSASNWLSTAVVRAGSAREARELAAKTFRQLQPAKPVNVLTPSPWLSEDLVNCGRLPLSVYPIEGPSQVLKPSSRPHRIPP